MTPSEYVLPVLIASINLRSVPPERPIDQECRRSGRASTWTRMIRQGFVDLHGVIGGPLRPSIAGVKRNLVPSMRRARIRDMASPIMNVELNPGGRPDVERR